MRGPCSTGSRREAIYIHRCAGDIHFFSLATSIGAGNIVTNAYSNAANEHTENG